MIRQTIGPYQILAKLGEGGMGVVYRARDSQLKREVAIKVLPAEVATDPERLARFQREAEVLASLNHPHIAHVYGVENPPQGGHHALVMELVEGEDLAQRLARGAIPLDEALPIARQIAEAVEAAHDAGIIHRDLKPANVKVRPDGAVKVLDFGLAKALSQDLTSSGAHDLASSPTITTPAMTMRGMILGTAAYMSPEQAKGKPVDQRADVWAFGCVLYEMLAGKKAFEGEDVTDTLTAVMRDTPDWRALPADTPPAIRTLLRQCIEKNPRRRAPHIAVARLAIEDAMTSPPDPVEGAASHSGIPQPSSRRPNWIAPAAFAAIVAAAAAGYLAGRPRGDEPPAVPYRSSIVIDGNLNPRAPSQRFAISPDGRRLVYAAAGDAEPRIRLWMRSLDGTANQVLPGTEGALGPFWSPDSRYVAFFAGNELKKIEVGSGSAPVTIAREAMLDTRGATGPAALVVGMPGSWNSDNVIIYGGGSGLMRVAAAGGKPEPLTEPGANQTVHDFPSFLPDGRHFLYAAYNRLTPAGLYVGSLDGGAPVQLIDDASNAVYANGFVLFMRGTTLMAQPFDAGRRVLSGEARPLVDAVSANVTARPAGAFSVARSGTIVYQSGQGGGLTRLGWSTRAGAATPLDEAPALYRDLKLSDDGTRLAYSLMDDKGRSDIWVQNLVRGGRTRLTFTGSAQSVAWAPDGRWIAFSGGPEKPGIWRKEVDGRVAEDRLDGSGDQPRLPVDVSSTGELVLYESFSPSASNDLWAVRIGGGSGEPIPVAASQFSERWGQFSPDSRWIAYTSDESGAREVYVMHYGGTGRWQVSSAGGAYPRWSANGRELYFYTPNGKISMVTITAAADAIEAGPVTPLFDARPPTGFGRYFFDVTPDGRFLLSVPTAPEMSTTLTLFVNWTSTLAAP